MRAAFGSDSVSYMQRQLKEWIDLSLNRNLPSSLLLLSRAFIFTHSAAQQRPAQVMNAVKETIGTFDDEVVSDMEVALDEENKIEAEKKLEYIKQQEELIAEEEASVFFFCAGNFHLRLFQEALCSHSQASALTVFRLFVCLW